MRKKLLLTLTVLLITAISTDSFAQIYSSRSRSIETIGSATPTVSPTTSYLRIGLNLASAAHYSNDDYNPSARLAYYLGYGFNRSILGSGAYWGMDFALSSRGYTYEYDSGTEISVFAHAVQISPINLGYKLPITSNIKVDAHFGGYVGYDYLGKYTYESSFGSESYSIWDKSGFKDQLDAGVNVGVGVWFNDVINIDISHQAGCVYKGCRTRNWYFKIGYAF